MWYIYAHCTEGKLVARDNNYYDTNTIREYNVDWKAERGQLNLAHVARNKKNIKKERETKAN